MNLEQILELWKEDCNIDQEQLGSESLKIPKLHHKYYEIYAQECRKLKFMIEEHKNLKLLKYEFYTIGPDESTPKDWRLPPRGMILKSEVQMYMDADRQIIESNLKISLQQQKVDTLEDIIKSIMTRNFIIKNGIDWNKFTNGG